METQNIFDIFFKKTKLISHHINSFDKFITKGIFDIIKSQTISIDKHSTLIEITFTDVFIPKPELVSIDRTITKLLPNDARLYNQTYDSPIHVTIKEEVFYKQTNVKTCKIWPRTSIGAKPFTI